MAVNHDTEQTMFRELLETKFLEFYGLEGWEYIVDNLVHDVYAPEDFGEDEESWEWNYELSLTEINAQKALAEYLAARMEDITGHEYKMVDLGIRATIEDI